MSDKIVENEEVHQSDCARKCDKICCCCFVGHKCWRTQIGASNIILLILSLCLLAFGIKAIAAPSGVPAIITNNVIYAIIVFAAFILFISIFGLVATCCRAFVKDKDGKNHKSCQLIVYDLILWSFFVAELIAVVFCLYGLSIIQTSIGQSYASAGSAQVDSLIQSWAAAAPSDWTNVQEFFSCCGYANATVDTTDSRSNPLATCGNPTFVVPCRAAFLDCANSNLSLVGGIGLVCCSFRLPSTPHYLTSTSLIIYSLTSMTTHSPASLSLSSLQ